MRTEPWLLMANQHIHVFPEQLGMIRMESLLVNVKLERKHARVSRAEARLERLLEMWMRFLKYAMDSITTAMEAMMKILFAIVPPALRKIAELMLENVNLELKHAGRIERGVIVLEELDRQKRKRAMAMMRIAMEILMKILGLAKLVRVSADAELADQA